ncbi:MAG TPA: organic hydroperoxide resistance protein, partial [Chitinophagaceae bacterium]|nr:organic hydroperoxide resistance protein [Chitinophagaceae bacterium]
QKTKTMETITKSKVLYTAKTHTVGGRDHGVAKSSDGNLDIKLSTPGTNGIGTNPEQLFAAGWSACFEGALGIAANKARVALPHDPVVDAEIDLCLDKGEFSLQARLNVSLPGLDREIGWELIHAAENICPYSKAIKGNVPAEINLV